MDIKSSATIHGSDNGFLLYRTDNTETMNAKYIIYKIANTRHG